MSYVHHTHLAKVQDGNMSAPTLSFVYKVENGNPVELGYMHYNVGWWYDETRLLCDHRHMIEKSELLSGVEWDYIYVYGLAFSREQITTAGDEE